MDPIFQAVLSIAAFLISCGALLNSIQAASSTSGALLSTRLEALKHVGGKITTETILSLKEAYQISKVTFGKKTGKRFDEIVGTITLRDDEIALTDVERFKSELAELIRDMIRETALVE